MKNFLCFLSMFVCIHAVVAKPHNPPAGNKKLTKNFNAEFSIAGTPVIDTLFPYPGEMLSTNYISFRLYFQDSIKKGTGTVKIRRSSDDLVMMSYSIDSSAVSITGKVLKFQSGFLSEGSNYYITIDSAAIRGIDDEPFGGVAKSQWFFNISRIMGVPIDNHGLAINSKIPAHTAANVDPLKLEIYWYEYVNKRYGNINIRSYYTDSIFQQIDVLSAAVSINTNYTAISISKLPPGTYYVEVEPGTFRNIPGSDFAGTGKTNWRFTIPGDDKTPLKIKAISPIHGSTGVGVGGDFHIYFNKLLQAPRFVNLRDYDTDTLANYTQIRISDSNAVIDPYGNALQHGTRYYLEVNPATFRDLGGYYTNDVTYDKRNWSFTTIAAPAVYTYDLAICDEFGPRGDFRIANSAGTNRWTCPGQGRNNSNAVTMDGNVNGVPEQSLDWFISPPMDLTGMDVPMLQFFSKITKPGPKLKILVSTTYDAESSPRFYTWTELDVSLPTNLNEWTISDSINLLPYKTHKTYFAWQYVADTINGAAAWTIDDIKFYSVPASAVIPRISSDKKRLHFNYLGSNTVSPAKSFYLTGKNLLTDVRVTAPAKFQLSKDSALFFTTLTFKPTEFKSPVKIFVRFVLPDANEAYGGQLIANFENRDTALLLLSGHSIESQHLLSVVSWDLDSFGADSLSLAKQENIKKIFQQLNADMYLIQKIVDTTRFASLVRSLQANYAVIVADQNDNNTAEEFIKGSKLAFVYKKDVFTDLRARLFMQGSSTAKANWPGGRLPMILEATAEKSGIRKKLHLINIDAEFDKEAQAADKNTAAANELADSLKTPDYNKLHFIIGGNYNDRLLEYRLDSSLKASSYKKLVADSLQFKSITLSLDKLLSSSVADSTVMFDHLIASDEMNGDYLPFSIDIVDQTSISGRQYKDSISNHYPIISYFDLGQTTVNLSPNTITGLPVLNNASDIVMTITGNPARESITAKFNKPLPGIVTVELANSKGLTVIRKRIDGSGPIYLNTNGLAKGFYILKATNGKMVFSSKVIIQ